MTTITKSTTIDCPPEHVFGVLADVDRLPEFSAMTVAVSDTPGRPLRTGDTFKQIVRVMGVELESEWEVVEVDEPRLLRVRGTGKAGVRAELTERIEPAGNGSRVELEVDYDLPLGILGEAIDSLVVSRRNEEEADNILGELKALCERA